MSPLNWDTAEELLSRDTLERLVVAPVEVNQFWLDHKADLNDPEYREAFESAVRAIFVGRYQRVLDRLEQQHQARLQETEADG